MSASPPSTRRRSGREKSTGHPRGGGRTFRYRHSSGLKEGHERAPIREANLDSIEADQIEHWFVRLADRELDRAYRMAGLILGDASEAADATQDALLRAWSAAASIREPDRFQAWFDRILINVCRDRSRRRRLVRFVPIDDEATNRPGDDPFRRFIDEEELIGALARLDLDLRTVVVLRFWADLPIDEIGRRLGWRSGTVKSRLHRAIGQMRASMSEQPIEPETVR
jgi:RNA polymerase sigma factor (sigma-70 family)